MKKQIKAVATIIIAITSFAFNSFSQSVADFSNGRDFTKEDLYKWRHQMNFQARYIKDMDKFDEMILRTEKYLPQWRQGAWVTWISYEGDKNSSDWFLFRTKLKEFYGELSEEYVQKWYIPLYVFLELDKSALRVFGESKAR